MDQETLRQFCLALPHVTEDIKWGQDLCFLIGEKMFCVTGLDQQPMTVSLKVTDVEFEALCATPHIEPAPYVGRYKWILVQDTSRFTKKEWEHYITQSYNLIRAKTKFKSK